MATTKTTTKKKITPVDLSDVMDTSCGEKVDLDKVSAHDAADIPDSARINVKSNVFGTLYFESKRMGETIEWGRCGEVQTTTLAVLRNMKMEAPRFFKDQWVIIVGFADSNREKFEVADIYQALFITQYYKNVVDPSNYAEICAWSPDEIAERVPLMSEGARANLAVALNTYIEKGVLDSVRAIQAFEKALGCSLWKKE